MDASRPEKAGFLCDGRGAIVEHPFGTIKRHFGYTYYLTRGLDSVNTEGSFICIVNNLKRLIKIVGVKELIRRFKENTDRIYVIFFGNRVKKLFIVFNHLPNKLLDRLTCGGVGGRLLN